MKRVRREDEALVVERNPIDVEITGLLAVQVKEIAGKSLGALFTMAQTQHWWLQVIQENRGELIVEHKDWHPWMRAMVGKAFVGAQMDTDEFVLELPSNTLTTGTEEEMIFGAGELFIPWPLFMPFWLHWNSLLLETDVQDRNSAWVHANSLKFPVKLLRIPAKWSARHHAFLETLFCQFYRVIYAEPEYDTELIALTLYELLTLLECALFAWQQSGQIHGADAVLMLLRWLAKELPEEWFDLLTDDIGPELDDVAPEIYDNIARWLPAFFLAVDTTEVTSLLYLFSRSINRTIMLPPIVPYALEQTDVVLTNSHCYHMGLVANDVLLNTLGYVSDKEELDAIIGPYIKPVVEVDKEKEPWSVYWTTLRKHLTVTNQLRLMFTYNLWWQPPEIPDVEFQ